MIEWLSKIPLGWGKIITIAGFAGIVVWVWIRPKIFILEGAPDDKWWRDLRIWASVAMGVQIVLYMIFR